MDSKILKRLEQLLNDGIELHCLTHIVPVSNNNIEHESLGKDGDAQYVEWKIKIKHLLKLICGNNSIHYEAFLNAERYQLYDTNAVVLNRLLPVIKATYDDLKNGFLITFKQIIQAEVFDSELEQAKSLLESGYKNAAAVIAGVVLETAIKELCLNNSIDLEKKKLNRLNDDLAKAGIYNTLQQKQILALADIRNNAAHGDYDEFTREDVERMISDIERFLLTYSS
ncbi:HEPN domain-containing protein [Acinetobacter oleivorans]|uniref:HEPN domain-containing protein n=1 Tax=Acinetobacter oleivorans TaxID=1148157 RepID=UPI001786F3CD|nr:HEPN domain-containing protein [Acinetobacter oleivorans]